MARKRRKSKKSPRRFPRLDIPKEAVQYERILRTTYNSLAKRKNPRIRFFNEKFDVYGIRFGGRNRIAFIDLALKLKDVNIDPALYLKIMSRYGKFVDIKWMPSPIWLSKDDTIEKFHWVYRKERKTYGLKLQFKKEISGWSDLDIYTAIRDSSKMYCDATEGLGINPDEAAMLLKKELSPWWRATSLLMSDDRKDFLICLDFLRKNRKLRHMAYKAFEKR